MDQERVMLAHGGGGELMRNLIDDHIVKRLVNPLLRPLDDGAVLDAPLGRIAFTTDSFVVRPLFFPGGDIGRLAVCGTVNDLAMMAARPICLSLGLIIPEGFPLCDLDRILDSIRQASDEAGVVIATGDTKVVERTPGEHFFINTAGIGELAVEVPPSSERVCAEDAILVSGLLGEHAIAVMSAREGLAFDTPVKSDVAPLWDLVKTLLEAGVQTKFLRDPTRGGIAATLAELAQGSGFGIDIEEKALPISAAVRGAADMLGLDPLVAANEGKLVAVVPAQQADTALAVMRNHSLGQRAAVIGGLTAEHPGVVAVTTCLGAQRILEMPYGLDLPRIC